MRAAPRTFPRKDEARRWLTFAEAQMIHTGNTLAAQTGTSLCDLMTSMGHDSPRAALIYQHASSGADRAIADALDLLIAATEESADKPNAAPDQDHDGTGQSTDLAG